MAKINFTNLSFNPTPGAVEHRLRAFPAGQVVTANEVYAAPFSAVGIDGVVDSAEIAGLGGGTPPDGFVADLYLTALDAAGNESDFVVKAGVPLDLVAPAAPSWN